MEQRVELKTRARELERNDQPEAALDLYRQIVSQSADGGSGAVWARIGELQERLGQRDAADSYSRAVEAFAEAGQNHNAIALCRSLLRVDPDSPGAQLRFGELSLAQGYREYARAGICAYARQVVATDDPYDAVEPIAAFLTRFPDEDELWRECIEELLGLGREDEAVAILERLRDILSERGLNDTSARLLDGIRKIRPASAPPSVAEEPRFDPVEEEPATPSDLPLLGVAPAANESALTEVAPLPGLEPTSTGGDWDAGGDLAEGAEPLPLLDASPAVEDDAGASPVVVDDTAEDSLPLLGNDPFTFANEPRDDDAGTGGRLEGLTGLLPEFGDEEHHAAAVESPEAAPAMAAGAAPALDVGQIYEEILPFSASGIEAADPATHYDLGLAYKEMGRIEEGLGNLAMAIRGGHDPVASLEVVGEILVERGESELAMRLLRAIPGAGERPATELVGVHYWLARAAEDAGKHAEARRSYDLVVSIDPDFRDASHRAGSLA